MLIIAAVLERPDSLIGSMSVSAPGGGVVGFSAAVLERPDSLIGSMSVSAAGGGVVGFSAAVLERPDSLIGSMSVSAPGGGVVGFSAAVLERPDSLIGSMRVGPLLICAVGATDLMLQGKTYIYQAGRVLIDNGRFLVAAISGRPMRFKSGTSANAWADLLITKAAAEVGYATALPPVRRLVWKDRKEEALRAYQGRLLEAAAKAADVRGQEAIVREINAVESKIAAIRSM